MQLRLKTCTAQAVSSTLGHLSIGRLTIRSNSIWITLLEQLLPNVALTSFKLSGDFQRTKLRT
jgi:hypothetical protein